VTALSMVVRCAARQQVTPPHPIDQELDTDGPNLVVHTGIWTDRPARLPMLSLKSDLPKEEGTR